LALVALEIGEVEQHVRGAGRQRQCAPIARLGLIEAPAGPQRDPEIGMRRRQVRHEFQKPLVERDRLIQLAGAVMAQGFGEQPARGIVGTAGHSR
jgi:hypothetical protein